MIREVLKIGITGNTGFLGRNLINKIHHVHEIITFTGNIQNIKDVEIFLKNDFDLIFHLAGIVPRYKINGTEELQSYDVNWIGTENILENLTKKTKIILASTVAVYGQNMKNFLHEDQESHPLSKYGKSKLKAEKILIENLSKTQYCILRFSNIYGYNPVKTNFIDTIAKASKSNYLLKLNINQNSLRDFVYISDAINALELSINSFGIYNIGFGKSYSISRILNIFNESGYKLNIEFKNVAQNDIVLDLTNAQTKLGYQPTIDIEEGIKKTLQSVDKK